MGRTYHGSSGLRYPAYVQHRDQQPLGKKPGLYPEGARGAPDGVHLLTALDRIRTYPGVESACLYGWGMPYYMGKP